MLVVCLATAKSFAFKFNCNKSHCLSLGKLAHVDIDPMLFDNQSVAWCHAIKYLGVHLLSSRGLSFDIASIKRVFYAACNNVFLILAVLMKSFSCLTLFKRHIAYQFCYMLHLLSTWNLSNYRSLEFAGIPFITTFLISLWKNQSNFYLGRFDLWHVIVFERVPFYNHLSVTDNSILSGLVWSYLHDYFNIDNCLNSVFKPVSAG